MKLALSRYGVRTRRRVFRFRVFCFSPCLLDRVNFDAVYLRPCIFWLREYFNSVNIFHELFLSSGVTTFIPNMSVYGTVQSLSRNIGKMSSELILFTEFSVMSVNLNKQIIRPYRN